MKTTEDNWAEVELFRWQYGQLPGNSDRRKLDVPLALQRMADAIEAGCKSGNPEIMPSPPNVCSVMRYAARLVAGASSSLSR